MKPQAAFYLFPKIYIKKFNITSDEKFVLDFLRSERILLVHGTGFNWSDPDHFRIVFLPTAEELKDAMFNSGNSCPVTTRVTGFPVQSIGTG